MNILVVSPVEEHILMVNFLFLDIGFHLYVVYILKAFKCKRNRINEIFSTLDNIIKCST